MTSKLTRLTDDELAETFRLATSGYPLSSSTEANLRHAFTELQERRKGDKPPVHPTVASEKLDDETLQELIEFRRTTFDYHSKEGNKVQTIIHGVMLSALRELQERRKAESDSEPVAEKVACWSCKNEVEISAIGDCDGYCPNCNSPIDLDDEPYTAPQPALDRDKVRREHAEWSQATFGDVGPVGPLKHLSKEALEAATEPDDLSEWADMQFLLWDAQRRAGITDEQITQAMIEKLAVNKQREWPAPKDGEPRLHIKEQPAPVAYGDFEEFWSAYTHPLAQDDELKDFAWDIWNAATLQAGTLANEGTIQAGNSPVIPDGWKMVPIDATRAMIDAAMRAEEDGYDAMHKAMLAAAPQEVPDGQR